MVKVKYNLSMNGLTYRIEKEDESLFGKSVGDKIDGKELMPELEGFELEIKGGSDIAGFPISKDVEGIGLRKLLLTKGWGMRDNREGVRLRKTVRGRVLNETTAQVNIVVLKEGKKKLSEVFLDQNKKEEPVKEEAQKEDSKTDNNSA
jgi:small subunit ribosomal protein S6e